MASARFEAQPGLIGDAAHEGPAAEDVAHHHHELVVAGLEGQEHRGLLYSGQGAAEVGYALGFDDPAYFARFVKRETGRAPTAIAGRGPRRGARRRSRRPRPA